MLTLGNKLTLNSQPIYHFVNKYSIDFDGSDQRIVTDGADTVLQNTTYSFWCKSSTTASNKGVFGHGGQQIGSFHFNFDGSKPLLYLGTNLWVYWNDTSAQDDGEWHHYVVYSEPNDLSNCKLYVDGVLQTVSSIESSGSLNAYTESLTIGSERQVGGDSFEGQIDEFAVYDRELTQDEITRMYNTYYSPNRVANGNFSQIGNEEVTNGDFSQIGSEQITNGDFATDSDWTFAGTNGEVSGGYGVFPDTTNSYIIQSSVVPASVKQYKLQYEVIESNGGGLGLSGGSSAFGSVNLTSSVGTHTKYITSNGTKTNLQFNNQASFIGKIDNVSIKEVGQDWDFGGEAEFNNGLAHFESNTNTYSYIRQDISSLTTKFYKIQVQVKNYVSGAIQVGFQGSSPNLQNINATSDGIYTVYLKPNGNGDDIEISREFSGGNFNFDIDNISVKEVGQHWTLQNGSTISGGVGNVVANGSIGSDYLNWGLYQNNIFNPLKNYKVKFRARQTSGSGNFQVAQSWYIMLNQAITSSFVDYSIDFTTNSNVAYTYLSFGGDTIGDTFEVDNIVVQELKHDATNLMLNAGAYQSANPLITSTKSMEFDGTDDYLQLSEPFNYTNHTICGWAYSGVTNANNIIFSASDSASDGIRLMFRSSSNFRYRINGQNIDTAADTREANRWYFVCGTYDGTTARLYIDGVELTNLTTSQTISTPDTSARIGSNSYAQSSFFDGKITEVGAYDRALTSLEVASLYNQGMPTNLLVNRNNYQSGNPTVFNTKQVDFDGTDDSLNLGNVLNLGTEDFSISMWVKMSGTSTLYIMGKYEDSANRWYIKRDGNDKFNFQSNTGSTNRVMFLSNTSIPTDEWVHLLISADRDGNVFGYINGVKDTSSGTTSANTIDNTGDFTIGKLSSSYFDGDMSQVGMWNSTLTADEVSSLYNHGLPIDLTNNQAAYESSSNLVGYWRMGSGTLDSYPLIADQTNATLGSELVTNGDFATDSDWTKGTGWTISGGKANSLNSSTSFYQASSFISGKSYKVTFDITNLSSGQVSYRTNATQNYFSENGTHTINWLYDGSFNFIYFLADNFTGSIDNVSVKQVNGNPAIMTNQSSSDIENGSPYANTLQYTNDFSQYSYGGTQPTLTTGQLAPDGTFTATKVSGVVNSTSLYLPGQSSTTASRSIYARTVSGTGTANLMSYGSNTNNNFTITEEWQRFELTGSSATGGTNFYAVDFRFPASNPLTELIIWGANSQEPNTGLQGYWKMGDGTNDEYPVIYDQTNPTLGSEVVTNGDFVTDSDWSKTQSTIANGEATIISPDGSYAAINQPDVTEAGKLYKYSLDIKSISGVLTMVIGSQSNSFTTSGTKTGYVNTTGTYLEIKRGGGVLNAVIDNVSIKEVQGNSAYMTNMVEGNITNQFPLTKIRNYYRMGDGILDGYPIIQDQTSPNLAHIPTTNEITYSEDFSQWGANDVTLESGYASPDGGNNAWKVTNAGANAHLVDYSGINTNKHKSIYARTVSGTGYVYLLCRTGNASALYNLSENWQRFDMQHIGSDFFYAVDFRSTTDLTEVLIFGAQLEAQSQATAYIKSDGIAAVRKSSTTNLIEYSEDFSGYTIGGITLTSQTETSPINTNDATLVTFTSGGHYLRKDVTVTANTVYTLSFYVKRGTATGLKYRMRDITNNVDILAPTSYYSETSNDWKRIQVTVTTPATCTTLGAYVFSDGGSTGTAFLWGVQLEKQTQAETYAKTTGLPVTIDLFTENNYGTMTNMSSSDIIEDTPNN